MNIAISGLQDKAIFHRVDDDDLMDRREVPLKARFLSETVVAVAT